MKRNFQTIIFLLIFIFIPQSVSAADVVINEYFPNPEGSSEGSEWIEIYNTTDAEIDLSAWKVDDVGDGGSPVYILPTDTKLAGKAFYVIERSTSGIILNNDSDTIRLLNDSDQEIDIYSYSETEDGIFYGRSTDGGLNWVKFSSPTKGSSNSSGTIIPTSTPEPTNTSIPTKSPTITKSPTATNAPTNTLAPTNTPLNLKKPSITSAKKQPSPTKKAPTKQVLGKSEEHKRPSESPKPTDKVQVKGSSGFNPGVVFISLGGIFLLSCGILLFYMKKKDKTV